MIKTFILYYLNVKPTHGYEIQRFIQLNGMDSWTKIQSGSIYYAIGKLDSEGLILLLRIESVGGKERKIYAITEKGRTALKESIRVELGKDIYEVGADKFVVYPFLGSLDNDEVGMIIRSHIEGLRSKMAELARWRDLKAGSKSLKVERVCFEMMLSSLYYQISWHEALLEELPACREKSELVARLIGSVDFASTEATGALSKATGIKDIERS